MDKKEIIKDIILKLHKGLSVEDAKNLFVKTVGNITSTEIAEIEQSLITDGMSPDEIKKFCNVHALIFKNALAENIIKEDSTSHPVYFFKLENREIEKITNKIKELIKNKDKYNVAQFKQELKNLIITLKGIDVHYIRKEQLLFPYLEKYGFFGPSKVMWGKDNEVRDLLKNAISNIDRMDNQLEIAEYIDKYINVLIEEVEGLIFKEENILFPTSLEKLNVNEWIEILKESDDVGYIFIEKPKDTTSLIKELKEAVIDEPEIKEDGMISFPTGNLKIRELMFLLNTLPVDITFVDKDDTVRYFSDNKTRIFIRTNSVIGRKVQNCHPPQSVERVEKILDAFKSGKKDYVDFWINFKERLIYIRYFALRDKHKNYLGTLEVTQDITEIKKIEGERRLANENN